MRARPERSRLGRVAARRRALAAGVRRVLAARYAACAVLAASAVTVGVLGAALSPSLLPLLVVPVLAGGLFLRLFKMVGLLCVVSVVLALDAVVLGVHAVGPGIAAAIGATAVVALVMSRFRSQLGMHSFRGESMLVELRNRIAAQGKVPKLPGRWHADAALASAESSFGGDFVVSKVGGDGERLDLAVVDVSGKGVDAGTRALLLSGAFGGLLGATPSREFLGAANSYLLRQEWEWGFATAVYLSVDLPTGRYVVENAGHPPVARFEAGSGQWRLSTGAGTVLGVTPDPSFYREEGVLAAGDALLLYTDGLVETPGRDLELGIDRLLGEADRLVTDGFAGGANALLDAMVSRHSDDRALALVWCS